MFITASLDEQFEQAAASDLRVLVVGAGVAGVTAAQLLRRHGCRPVLIERQGRSAPRGYMLALMPMVDPVFDDLAAREAYRAASVPLNRYAVYGHTGRRLRVDSTAELMSLFGDYRGIARGHLLAVLADSGCPVTFDTTVTALTERPNGVDVTVSCDGAARRLTFDLVIIADGMHSTTRELMCDGEPVDWVDTGWGGWVAWADPDADTDLGAELWGAGGMVAMYPVAGELGVFLGGPRSETAAGAAPFVSAMRRRLKHVDARLDRAMAAVVTEPDAYYWSLTDCRAPRWTTARTVLLGDAAAGFLPTAGVGAGMAMESAWLLARLLSHADRVPLADLLCTYERAQRPRVEAAQDNSRRLAGLMFRRSRALAVARELAVRFVSVERALRPIQRLLQERPDPDALVDVAAGTSVATDAL